MATTRSEGRLDKQFPRLGYDTSKPAVRFTLMKINDGPHRVFEGGEASEADGGSPDCESDHVEHIWPRSDPSGLDKKNVDLIDSIGNLTVWDMHANPSASAAPAVTKLADWYPKCASRFIIIRNLKKRLDMQHGNEHLAQNQAVGHCPTGFSDWDSQSVATLASMYLALLDVVMPPPAGASD